MAVAVARVARDPGSTLRRQMPSSRCRASPAARWSARRVGSRRDAASRSSTPRINTTRFACSKYGPDFGSFGCGSQTRSVSSSEVAMPVCTACRFQRLRTSRPAPTSSTSAMATWAITSALRRRGAHAAVHALAGRLQVIADVGARRLQRRTETDEQAGDHRGQQREQEDASVHADVRHARQPVGHETQQQIDAPQAGQETGGAAGEGEHCLPRRARPTRSASGTRRARAARRSRARAPPRGSAAGSRCSRSRSASRSRCRPSAPAAPAARWRRDRRRADGPAASIRAGRDTGRDARAPARRRGSRRGCARRRSTSPA